MFYDSKQKHSILEKGFSCVNKVNSVIPRQMDAQLKIAASLVVYLIPVGNSSHHYKSGPNKRNWKIRNDV
jgi:hypothetical protein